ncbi:putative small integral membrane protein [Desulfobaculum xiamenense]|uniref:Putative small integral membrane protein n=1 Tax=Desulfobaculum xiamenense TaxID=995050 RepID=A0A846QV86_9BACT|nr:DUF2160 family membrane protein [Desulfobaculum xiamenense]NJB68559.1 putative small integral membrane protein [Desulfobaculum xiamenense]
MWDWILEQTAWMYWTAPSLLAIGGLLVAIAGMAAWDVVSPSVPRRGFYPIETRRGDRFFIAIMSTILIFLLWLGFVGDENLLVPAAASAAWGLVQGRWG